MDGDIGKQIPNRMEGKHTCDEENEPVLNNSIGDRNRSLTTTEVDEFNDSNEFLNHAEDTNNEKNRCSGLKNGGSTSTETVEENEELPDSTAGNSDFVAEFMTKIINERIGELLDLPDVANFIKSKQKESRTKPKSQ